MHRALLHVAMVLILLPGAGFRTAPADNPRPDGPGGSVAGPIQPTITESLWPTDAGRVVTSTFGEFRTSHFHAGIDISTDVTGYRVFAARDGYVSRISISPHGYGKMLMVTHPDGYVTLYAHLSRFASRIEAIARRTQDSLGRYPVRIHCEPGTLPVERGELIAYTGDTGTGTPHLHFEIHDDTGDPLNPLQCDDFGTTDNLPPVISRVAVIPLGPGSRVNGGSSPVLLRPSGIQSVADRLVRVEGSAAFAVEARDPVNGTHFRRSAYRHTLTIDDRIFFATSLDRVDGRYLQLVGYHYDWPLWLGGSGRYERLFVPDSLTLSSVRNAGPSGGILSTAALSAGTHRYTIVSEDFAGNRSEVGGYVLVEQSPAVPPAPGHGASYTIRPGSSGRYEIDGGMLVIEYDSLSVFTPFDLQIAREMIDGVPSYTLGPESIVLRDGIRVTLRVTGAGPSTGLFLRRRGNWMLIGRRGADGLLHGTIHRQLGEITALEDDAPPAIRRFSVSTVRRGVPLISFRYRDDLSGIDYEEFKVYLDGQAVIPEVDGEHRRARYQSEQLLAYGTHHVSIRLQDRLGNLRTYDHRFVLR